MITIGDGSDADSVGSLQLEDLMHVSMMATQEGHPFNMQRDRPVNIVTVYTEPLPNPDFYIDAEDILSSSSSSSQASPNEIDEQKGSAEDEDAVRLRVECELLRSRVQQVEREKGEQLGRFSERLATLQRQLAEKDREMAGQAERFRQDALFARYSFQPTAAEIDLPTTLNTRVPRTKRRIESEWLLGSQAGNTKETSSCETTGSFDPVDDIEVTHHLVYIGISGIGVRSQREDRV